MYLVLWQCVSPVPLPEREGGREGGRERQGERQTWMTSLGAKSPLNKKGSPWSQIWAGRRHPVISPIPVQPSPSARGPAGNRGSLVRKIKMKEGKTSQLVCVGSTLSYKRRRRRRICILEEEEEDLFVFNHIIYRREVKTI